MSGHAGEIDLMKCNNKVASLWKLQAPSQEYGFQ
jgi:hypothetical protein